MANPSHIDEAPPDDAQIVFAGSLSHELRAPLASILGYTQLLYEELDGRLDPHHHEFFQTILSSIGVALELVNDLVDFARIASGHQELRMAPVALHALCDEVAQQLGPAAREKGLTLNVSYPPRPLYAEADVLRLRQVAINLVLNGIKYTERGSVTMRLIDAGADRVALQVADTGRGIGGDFLPRLFDRFSRETRMAEVVQQGAGIGLAIALEYVRLMNGSIDVRSAPGEGATFTVTLPRARLSFG